MWQSSYAIKSKEVPSHRFDIYPTICSGPQEDSRVVVKLRSISAIPHLAPVIPDRSSLSGTRHFVLCRPCPLRCQLAYHTTTVNSTLDDAGKSLRASRLGFGGLLLESLAAWMMAGVFGAAS